MKWPTRKRSPPLRRAPRRNAKRRTRASVATPPRANCDARFPGCLDASSSPSPRASFDNSGIIEKKKGKKFVPGRDFSAMLIWKNGRKEEEEEEEKKKLDNGWILIIKLYIMR